MTYDEAFDYAFAKLGYGKTIDRVRALLDENSPYGQHTKEEIAKVLPKWADRQSQK